MSGFGSATRVSLGLALYGGTQPSLPGRAFGAHRVLDDTVECGHARTRWSRSGRGHGRQRCSVTLVHGTFARDAAWTATNSAMSVALTEAGCRVTRFEWSGRNSHWARSRAGRQLAEHLGRQVESDPDARQWIVAHSHGGNVALRAAEEIRRSRGGRPRVTTVSLATPFIHARARVFSSWLLFVAILFGPFLVFVAGQKTVADSHSLLDWVLGRVRCRVRRSGGPLRRGCCHAYCSRRHKPWGW